MKKSIIALAIASISFSAIASTTKVENRYLDAKDSKVIALENGSMVSEDTYLSIKQPESEKSQYTKTTIVQVADNVWTFNFGSIVNLHMVEAPEGLILYDTGENSHEAELFWNAMREVSDKPIKAIIYSHEHYTTGSGKLIELEAERGNTDIMVIGNKGMNESMASNGGVGKSTHQEVSGVLVARTLEQFGVMLSKDGPDAKQHKYAIDMGYDRTYIPVNTPVSDGQTLDIAGYNMTFYTDNIGTDSSFQVMAKIDEIDLVMNNVLWGFFPNIYSARGGMYRNPEQWINSLAKVESLNPKILLTTHSKSLNDPEVIVKKIQDYSDSIKFVVDQTLKGINEGLTGGELAHSVKLPKHLTESPLSTQNYGEILNMIPMIEQSIMGPFDRDAANLIPMAESDEARLMIDAFGEELIKKRTLAAFEKGDYLFSAKLATYLVDNNPTEENKQLKANALRKMAQLTFSTNSRSWFLTQARVLEGEINVLTNAPVEPEQIVIMTNQYVNFFRTRINDERSIGTDKTIGFKFKNGETSSLQIRSGVVYFNEGIDKADVIVEMENITFTALYNNVATIDQLIQAGKVKTDNAKLASMLFSQFDIVYDWNNDPALQDLAKMMAAKSKS